jgi:glutaconate CoA-transferase subunit B
LAQRVALARALVNDPDLLILDEPLGKLDSLTRLSMRGEIVNLWRRAGYTVLLVAHEPKRLADKVTYICSPGYLDGGDSRERHGFVGGGPSAIVTTLGILRPEPGTNEFVLDGWFPFSSVEEITANAGWTLRVAPDAREIAAPSATELAHLRKVDETGALRKK